MSIPNLDLLTLATAGAKSLELDRERTENLVQYNSYVIESLAGSIEATTCEGEVDQDQAMSALSCAQMIKFLSGLNAYLSDSVR